MQSISDTSSRNASGALRQQACSPKGVFVPARLSAEFTFEQSQCSKTQSMNAARSSAMPLMRQPVKRHGFETSAREVALRQREVFKQDEFNVGFLFGGLRKQRREIGAREYCSCGVLCFISTRSIAHTATHVQQKKTTPEECMLKNPTPGESLCSFVRQYVIMVSK